MFSGLIAGILFACGHHAYYSRKDGEFVESTTSQEWVDRVGTGSTFLVRISFSVTLGVVIVQYF